MLRGPLVKTAGFACAGSHRVLFATTVSHKLFFEPWTSTFWIWMVVWEARGGGDVWGVKTWASGGVCNSGFDCRIVHIGRFTGLNADARRFSFRDREIALGWALRQSCWDVLWKAASHTSPMELKNGVQVWILEPLVVALQLWNFSFWQKMLASDEYAGAPPWILGIDGHFPDCPCFRGPLAPQFWWSFCRSFENIIYVFVAAVNVSTLWLLSAVTFSASHLTLPGRAPLHCECGCRLYTAAGVTVSTLLHAVAASRMYVSMVTTVSTALALPVAPLQECPHCGRFWTVVEAAIALRFKNVICPCHWHRFKHVAAVTLSKPLPRSLPLCAVTPSRKWFAVAFSCFSSRCLGPLLPQLFFINLKALSILEMMPDFQSTSMHEPTRNTKKPKVDQVGYGFSTAAMKRCRPMLRRHLPQSRAFDGIVEVGSKELQGRDKYQKKKYSDQTKLFPDQKETFTDQKKLKPSTERKESSVLWSSGPLVLWSSRPLVPWTSGPLVLWSPGPLAGPLVLWSPGPSPLVPWSSGPLVSGPLLLRLHHI